MDWDSIFPVVTLVLGYVASMATEAQRDARQAKRQLRQALHDFQRNTLLTLQDAMGDLVRAVASIAHHMQMEERAGTPWDDTQISEEHSDAHFTAEQLVAKLSVRVLDDPLRKSVTSLLAFSHNITEADSSEMLRRMHGLVAGRHEEASKRIGQLLRDEYL